MDLEKNALAEKIINDMGKILKRNPYLETFELIPVETNNQNKSPVVYISNCLGVEQWCVKHIYMYAYNQIFENFIRKEKMASIHSEKIIKYLNVTLLINPELCSLWNRRRELVKSDELKIMNELRFSRLVLSRKFNSYDTFAYRRWLISSLMKDTNTSTQVFENQISEDFQITAEASERCPNNYHSWNHRMWLYQTISQFIDITRFCIDEYIYSEKWMTTHISDHSGYHYRQFCLKNVNQLSNSTFLELESKIYLNYNKYLCEFLARNNIIFDDSLEVNQDKMLEFLLKPKLICSCGKLSKVLRNIHILTRELCLNNELLIYYKNHETLWYHRRFIIDSFSKLIYNYYGYIKSNKTLKSLPCKCIEHYEKQAKISRIDVNSVYTNILYKLLLDHETKFVNERLSEGDEYADRHKKYLIFIQGFSL